MSDLPDRWGGPSEVEVAERAGGSLERPSRRGLVLSPAEKAARRHNRRWMLGIAVPSIAVLLTALIASGVAESNQPNGPSITAPAGYQVHRDGYFSYVVPAGWTNNPTFTDSTGDVDTSGPTGWAAEHIGYRSGPPVPGEPRPSSLQAFGMPSPQAYQLSAARPVTVKGASVAYSYRMSRPGFEAAVIDAWSSRSAVEIWLVVHAPTAVTDRIVGSLSA